MTASSSKQGNTSDNLHKQNIATRDLKLQEVQGEEDIEQPPGVRPPVFRHHPQAVATQQEQHPIQPPPGLPQPPQAIHPPRVPMFKQQAEPLAAPPLLGPPPKIQAAPAPHVPPAAHHPAGKHLDTMLRLLHDVCRLARKLRSCWARDVGLRPSGSTTSGSHMACSTSGLGFLMDNPESLSVGVVCHDVLHESKRWPVQLLRSPDQYPASLYGFPLILGAQ